MRIRRPYFYAAEDPIADPEWLQMAIRNVLSRCLGEESGISNLARNEVEADDSFKETLA